MTRISFHTFGCRLNQSETAALEHSFERDGYQVVGMDEPSDIVVINTCTVTEGGDADTRRLVHKINRLNPGARIALVGCQAQVQKERLAHLPGVRWIVGNGRKMDLLSVFKEFPETRVPHLITPAIERSPFVLPLGAHEQEHTRANIKVQDGCDFFCSFCEIPYARGRARSRVFEDIMAEAARCIEAGHQELVLTGINIGTYAFQGRTLLDIIQAMAGIPGLQRLRLSSIEPTTVDERIFEHMGEGRKLCRYLHLPLQSGDDEILRWMKRRYTVEEFSRFVRRVQSKIPQMCIGTDVIVGFPGETEAHFERTLELLRTLPIHYFHVFSYSPRHMAQSRLKQSMPARLIARRSQILRDLSSAKRRSYHHSLLGSTQHVLFERPKGDGWQNGLTDHYVRVKVREPRPLFNQILPVRLERLDGQAVTGTIL